MLFLGVGVLVLVLGGIFKVVVVLRIFWEVLEEDEEGGWGWDLSQGRSVPHASQQRWVEGLMRVQIPQAHVSGLCSGMVRSMTGDDDVGLVDEGIGGGAALEFPEEAGGWPWLPAGFSLLTGM